MALVQVAGWTQHSWLRHGFSSRTAGVSTVYGGDSLNLGFTREDDPARVQENRSRFAREAWGGVPAGPLITLRQIHSATIHVVRSGDDTYETPEGRARLEGDGLVTNLPGTLLGIQTADCVPVILVDPQRRVVGNFHAGWRGTVARIVEEGVAKMAKVYGSAPGDLLAAVGPSIGACCYVVGDEVQSAFRKDFTYADELFQDDRLNLWEANRRQLVEAGIRAENITVIGECTGCACGADGERKYFSHRIDKGVTGRMMSIVAVSDIP